MIGARTPWAIHSIMLEDMASVDRRLARWPLARNLWRIPAFLIAVGANAGVIFAHLFCLNVVPYNLEGIVRTETLWAVTAACFTASLFVMALYLLRLKQTLSQRVIVPEYFSAVAGCAVAILAMVLLLSHTD